MALVKRYLELRIRSEESLNKLLSERGLDEGALKEFEEFRDELWREEGRKKFNL